MTSTGFLEVQNGRLYYEVAGDGPAVVFVHGFSLDTRMWDDQWALFAQKYRVVRVDLRGFGRSEQEPVAYSDLEDLVALLDHLQIERAHIIGLSMGAMVVVDFAIAHPERVASLIAVDGGPGGLGGAPPEMQTITALAASGQLDQALENWLATALFAPANEQPNVAARLREIVSDYTWWRAQHPGLLVGLEPPAASRLGEITAPTLVVVGERERPGVRVGCDALGAEIRGARMVVLPRVGHMSNMEDPHGFNAAVLDFLANQA